MKKLLCRKYPSITRRTIKANRTYTSKYIRCNDLISLAPSSTVREEINDVIDTINYWLKQYDYDPQNFRISNIELYDQSEDEDEEWYSFDLTDSDGFTFEATCGVIDEDGEWIPYSEVYDTSDGKKEIVNKYFKYKGIKERV